MRPRQSACVRRGASVETVSMTVIVFETVLDSTVEAFDEARQEAYAASLGAA